MVRARAVLTRNVYMLKEVHRPSRARCDPRADEQELDGEHQLPLQCVSVMLAVLLLLTSRGQTTRTMGLTRARSE